MTPMVFEYFVYNLDDDCEVLSHIGEPILATNCLAVACSYCYDYYNKYKKSICVWQPRHNCYREHYSNQLPN